jgi:hypothetical protein
LLARALPSIAAASGMKFAASGTLLGWLTPEFEKDFDGTLRTLASIGYRDVELSGGDFGRSPTQLLHSFRAAGLRCASTVFALQPETADLDSDVSKQIEFAQALSLKYLVTILPVPMGIIPLDKPWTTHPKRLAVAFSRLTRDDFRARSGAPQHSWRTNQESWDSACLSQLQLRVSAYRRNAGLRRVTTLD